MGVLSTQVISIPASSILSAWNTVPVSFGSSASLTIPSGTQFVEIVVQSNYIHTKTLAPSTPLKSTYPAIQSFRPVFQMASVVSGVQVNTILNPFGITAASAMGPGTAYDAHYTVVVPIPKASATGTTTLTFQLVPETYGSTALNNWQFNSFTGTARCYG